MKTKSLFFVVMVLICASCSHSYVGHYYEGRNGESGYLVKVQFFNASECKIELDAGLWGRETYNVDYHADKKLIGRKIVMLHGNCKWEECETILYNKKRDEVIICTKGDAENKMMYWEEDYSEEMSIEDYLERQETIICKRAKK